MLNEKFLNKMVGAGAGRFFPLSSFRARYTALSAASETPPTTNNNPNRKQESLRRALSRTVALMSSPHHSSGRKLVYEVQKFTPFIGLSSLWCSR